MLLLYKAGTRGQDDVEVADSSSVDVSPTGHITLVMISFHINEHDLV